ncbi:MAG: PilC/PilY family type IV pilus protein [Methylococcales bacterium]|nr:PilC/PilY family type IV pilus protein [Methylococcales bacterium]
MIIRPFLSGFIGFCVLISCSINTGVAAPGKLADSPLFTSASNTPPNVFFEVDDSGSMDWEILLKHHWGQASYDNTCYAANPTANPCQITSVERPAGTVYRFYNPNYVNDNNRKEFGNKFLDAEYLFSNSSNSYIPSCEFTDSDPLKNFDSQTKRRPLELCSDEIQKRDWRIKSSALNVMYYNPSIEYTPWDKGNGVIMDDASFSSARANPQSGAEGYSIRKDLTGLVYNVWEDTHGFSGSQPILGNTRTEVVNGEVDWWDEHLRYTVNSSSIKVERIGYQVSSSDVTEYVISTKTLSGSTKYAELNDKNVTEAKQNIANWYQYSRNRAFVAKTAISKVIADNPKYYYGLNFINDSSFPYNGSTSNFVEVPTTSTDLATHNVDLVKGLFSLDWPKKNTPLRKGLNRIGQYYDNTDGKRNPIIQECQQNFSILFTDGFWNMKEPSGVGDVDSDGHSLGTETTTVADVARHYYTKDLSSLDNNVIANDFDTVTHQHMVTYTVAFGVKGLLVDTDGDGWPNPALLENSPNWGDPFGTNAASNNRKIDDLWHAAFNSKGKFISAETPEDVSRALSDALTSIGDRVGSIASVAFSTSALTGSTDVYLAQFESADNQWTGDLLAYPLSSNGDVSSTKRWSAADQLNTRSNPSSTRNIFTYNNTKGIPFLWNDLVTEQKNDFRLNPNNSIADDTKAEARLKYLRGDQAHEKGRATDNYNFKYRKSLLGDSIHSEPIFVAKPQLFWPSAAPFPEGSNSYEVFKESSAKNREGIVYVGFNDGMLHGFKASDGSEAFAYIPATLFSSHSATEGLHYLTSLDYKHRYYVDMPLTISDAYLNNKWHTILIGGGRGGSRGLFALDITDPTQFTQTASHADKLVLWEFDEEDDADMGYTFSKPSIVLMNNGRWAAVFGNGYNSSGDGTASLFILFLDGGNDGEWTDGSQGSSLDYVKISTKTGSINQNSTCLLSSDCNGLSSPQAVDVTGNKVIDRVYAGDLQGNMWAFDVSSANSSQWGVAYGTNNNPKPLFIAKDSTNKPQPITQKPLLSKHPQQLGGDPDVLVFFGTGQYLVDGDASDTSPQSFYGVWDNGSDSIKPSDLVKQTFVSGSLTNKGKNVSDSIRILTDHEVDYEGGQHGWAIDLTAAPGERMIVDADLRGDFLSFNTWIPEGSACGSGGSGFLMLVKLLNGGNPEGVLFDVNNDGKVDSVDKIGVSGGDASFASGIVYSVGFPASSVYFNKKRYIDIDNPTAVTNFSKGYTGRLSWQELRR